MNGKRERCKACLSKVMGSYVDNKCKLQLYLISWWEGTCFLSQWQGQRQHHSFVCSLDILFCSTHKHKLCCYDHGNLLVWGFRPSWAGVFDYYRLKSSYHHTHMHTNPWLIFMPFCLSLLGWNMCDLTLQLTDVAAGLLNWMSEPPAQHMAVKAHCKLCNIAIRQNNCSVDLFNLLYPLNGCKSALKLGFVSLDRWHLSDE